MAISVLTIALTARTLGSSGFGVLNGMTAYVGLFGVLTDLGLTTTAMQRMAAEPEREEEWLGALGGARMALSLVATVICVATIPLLLTDAHSGHTVGFILSGTILVTAPQALTSVFQARVRSGLLIAFSMFQSFAWLATVVLLTLAHGSVVAFAAGNVGVVVALSALQMGVTGRFAKVAWRRGVALWRPLMRVAIPLGMALVLITVYFQVDSVLLLQMAGPREAGIYAAAYRFLTPLISIPGLIMVTFFPVMSAVKDSDPQRLHRLVQTCADLMALVSLPVLAVAIALSSQIVHLLYSSSYAGASSLLPILMLAFVAICYGNLSGFLAPLLGLQRRLALYSGIGAVANLVVNVVLIPRYGAHGAAWVTAGTEFLTMALMMATCLATLRIGIALRRIARMALLAAGMAGVMLAAAPLGLVPAAILGTLLYGGGIFALRVVQPSEIRSLRRVPAGARG